MFTLIFILLLLIATCSFRSTGSVSSSLQNAMIDVLVQRINTFFTFSKTCKSPDQTYASGHTQWDISLVIAYDGHFKFSQGLVLG